jgi:hypothetical protein
MKEETVSPSGYILYMSLGKRASYVSEKVVEGTVIRVTVYCIKITEVMKEDLADGEKGNGQLWWRRMQQHLGRTLWCNLTLFLFFVHMLSCMPGRRNTI